MITIGNIKWENNMKLKKTIIITVAVLMINGSLAQASATSTVVSVLQNQKVTKQVSVTTTLISEVEKSEIHNGKFNGFEIIFNDKVIDFDTKPQVIEGKVMVPLRFVAEALGYKVIWNGEKNSVDLMKGPQFTSVYIGSNSYFKNKMAASPLSIAPTIMDERTMVPVEFLTEILGYGVEFQNNKLKVYDESLTTLTGYVSNMKEVGGTIMVTVAPRLGDDVEMWETTILMVNEDTIINREPIKEGDLINAVHLPVMTMSIPGQTGAVVIY